MKKSIQVPIFKSRNSIKSAEHLSNLCLNIKDIHDVIQKKFQSGTNNHVKNLSNKKYHTCQEKKEKKFFFLSFFFKLNQ